MEAAEARRALLRAGGIRAANHRRWRAMYYARDASPGGDAYCGFQQRRPGVESYTRSDRLLIAAPPSEGDANKSVFDRGRTHCYVTRTLSVG
ncbi:hypothetical protein MRX96_058897 [Rhipicephalus microplus]